MYLSLFSEHFTNKPNFYFGFRYQWEWSRNSGTKFVKFDQCSMLLYIIMFVISWGVSVSST